MKRGILSNLIIAYLLEEQNTLCTPPAGGSQAVFFKMNTLGEESFLDDVKDLLEEILEE